LLANRSAIGVLKDSSNQLAASPGLLVFSGFGSVLVLSVGAVERLVVADTAVPGASAAARRAFSSSYPVRSGE
jgi:hypothetical protein